MKRAQARREVIDLFGAGAVGAEIGVWQGDFSAEILDLAKPVRLHLIDPWALQADDLHKTALYGRERGNDMEAVYQGVLARFATQLRDGRVAISRSYSAEALSQFPNDHFDFIYIDGDHAYPAVRSDCFGAFDKVKPGGLICGDDYAVSGWWGRGVVDAFHELLAERATILKFVAADQIVVQKLPA